MAGGRPNHASGSSRSTPLCTKQMSPVSPVGCRVGGGGGGGWDAAPALAAFSAQKPEPADNTRSTQAQRKGRAHCARPLSPPSLLCAQGGRIQSLYTFKNPRDSDFSDPYDGLPPCTEPPGCVCVCAPRACVVKTLIGRSSAADQT